MLNLKVIGNQLIVSQSDAKERFYSESTLLHHVKIALQKAGLDVIKIGQTGIAKDGHLIANDYILTHRKRHYSIYDAQCCIRNIAKDFNTDGKANLTINEPDHTDFNQFKTVYIKKTSQEKFNLKRSWFVTCYRITDASNNDVIQPYFQKKADAINFCKSEKYNFEVID